VLPHLSLSSRGLGHRPFTAVTGVRIPVGTPNSKKPLHLRWFFLAGFLPVGLAKIAKMFSLGLAMQYRCPKCQSAKIMPLSQGAHSPRPHIPNSLLILLPSVLLLVLLVLISLGMLIFADGAGQTLQIAVVVVFCVAVAAGLFFWRDFADFKISIQAFMQQQKHWTCRDCHHEWHN
jgi:hypothetical protein